MGLNALYGSGARQSIVAAAERARSDVSASDSLDGSRGEVYVTAIWTPSIWVSLACHADRVHFSGIKGPASFYKGLCRELPDAFKSLGVLTFTACAGNLTAKQQLRAEALSGFEGDGLNLVWVL